MTNIAEKYYEFSAQQEQWLLDMRGKVTAAVLSQHMTSELGTPVHISQIYRVWGKYRNQTPPANGGHRPRQQPSRGSALVNWIRNATPEQLAERQKRARAALDKKKAERAEAGKAYLEQSPPPRPAAGSEHPVNYDYGSLELAEKLEKMEQALNDLIFEAENVIAKAVVLRGRMR